MTTGCASYENTRSELLSRYNNICTKEQLGALVDIFKERIRSVRRIDNVNSLQELLQLLEKRCVLSQWDFASLDIIAGAFGLNISELGGAEHSHVETGTATYTPVRAPPSPPNHGPPRFPILPLHPTTARERIYNLVINEIGLKWKELARNLGVTEGKIDELEEKHRYSPSERVREILMFNEVNASARWTHTLADALFNSRRADLSKEVQNIVIGNY